MIPANDRPADDDATRFRILRKDGRTYPVKLEEPYWRILEEQARRLAIRLNHLVADLAATDAAELSLAARLRVFALKSLERQLTDAEASIGTTRPATVMVACPMPVLLLNDSLRVQRLNEPAQAWLGRSAPYVVGSAYDAFLRWRLPLPGDQTFRVLRSNPGQTVSGTVLFVIPGIVKTAKTSVCTVGRRRDGRTSFLAFLRG